MDAGPEAAVGWNVVSLTQQLVDIPSPTGEEQAVCRWLTWELRHRGFSVRLQPVESDRANLFASLTEKPLIWLCTHLDTVSPWVTSTVDERNGVIYGRGACDAKGIASAMIIALQRLRSRHENRVGLLFVVGEETDSIGAKKAAELDLKSRFVVVGEPTGNRLVTGQKGTLVFRVTARGEPGHSADPGAGPSAVHRLLEFLGDLHSQVWRQDEIFGDTTLNTGRIGGGVGANVVAGEAFAEGIFRIASSTGEVMRRIEGLPGEGIRFEVVSRSEPLRLYTAVGFEQTVVAFGSDAPYLHPLGEVLMVGPGSIHFAHRDDERVSIRELEDGVDVYVRLARILLAEC